MMVTVRVLYRATAIMLVWLMLSQPLLAAGSRGSSVSPESISELYQRYARGEISLSELEAARARRTETLRDDVRVGVAPGPAEPSVSPEKEKAGFLSNIGHWVADIPSRMKRRFVNSDDITDIDEAIEFLDTAPVKPYYGNAAQREADSDVLRPIKVTALTELQTSQDVLERFLAFNALKVIGGAAQGNSQFQRMLDQAKKVVSRLTPAQRQTLGKSFTSSALGRSLTNTLSKSGVVLGKVVKDKSGQNMVLTAMAAALVGAFFDDGLDLDQLRDNLVALNAIQEGRMNPELMIGGAASAVAYYHMNDAGSLLFNKLYNKAARLPATAGFFRSAEKSVGSLGQSIVKRMTPSQAAEAARLGKAAKGLGLPGVTTGEVLSFRALAENTFKGLGMGMSIKFLMDSTWKLTVGLEDGWYIGGRREKLFVKPDLVHTYFQKTGNKFRDAIEERRVAMMNHLDAYKKFKSTQFLAGFGMYMGGYLGAVLASSLIGASGLVGFGVSLLLSAVVASGFIAFGNWIGAKIDMSKSAFELRRRANEKRLRKMSKRVDVAPAQRRVVETALANLDEVRREAKLRKKTDLKALEKRGGALWGRLVAASREYQEARLLYCERVDGVIASRAEDYEKLIRGSQIGHYIITVDDLSAVRLVKEGDYVKMIVDEGRGMPFKANASPRYDIITTDGRRGVWDYKTNRIVDCGPMGRNNGLRIMFIDDAEVEVSGDNTLQFVKGKNVRTTANGIVFARANTGDWLVKGYGGEYDIVLRGTAQRFAWDGKAFSLVPDVPSASGPQAETSGLGGYLERRRVNGLRRKREDARERLADASKTNKIVLDSLRDLARLAKTNGATTAERVVAVALR